MQPRESKADLAIGVVVLFGSIYAVIAVLANLIIHTTWPLAFGVVMGSGALLWAAILVLRKRHANGSGKIGGFMLLLTMVLPVAALFVISRVQVDAANRPYKPVVDYARPACLGQALPGAADYSGAPGVHPTVILYTGARPTGGKAAGYENVATGDQYPEGWWPSTPAATELVVCVRIDEVLLHNCEYGPVSGVGSGGSIMEHQYKATVSVVAAKTGATLGAFPIEGSDPGDCPSTMTFRSDTPVIDAHGSYIGLAEIAQQISWFVSPP